MLVLANVLKTVNSVPNLPIHETGVQVYPFMDDEIILDAARKAKEAGAIRFSIVTSGRNTNNPNEFDQIIRVLGRIKMKVGLEICCSLGLLTYEQALKLKEVGVTRYHPISKQHLVTSQIFVQPIPTKIKCLPSIMLKSRYSRLL